MSKRCVQALSGTWPHPGPYAAENLHSHEAGRFFDDYCNWQRIPEFREVIETSPAAQVAAELMQSQTAQVFHDHVLVKEPGTSKPTPWHQDGPYYFVEGPADNQPSGHLWIRSRDASLRCVAGSHLWDKPVLPTRWLSEEDFYPGEQDAYMPVPDPDAEGMRITEWEMERRAMRWPSTMASCTARGAMRPQRRRAFSLRLWATMRDIPSGRDPPRRPSPGHGMTQGQKLREDWFPQIWPRDRAGG